MTQIIPGEEVALFPSSQFPRCFSAIGKAAPPPEKQIAKMRVFLIHTDVSTSIRIVYNVYKGPEWWKAAGASLDFPTANLDFPTISVNFNPEWEGLAARWPETGSSTRRSKPESQEGKIENFLEEVYSLVRLNDIESATDLIFDYIDQLLCDGAFVTCDELLKRVEVGRIPTTLMRAFLAITSAGKDRLPSRIALYHEIEKKMVELRGPETTKRLIGRLA